MNIPSKKLHAANIDLSQAIVQLEICWKVLQELINAKELAEDPLHIGVCFPPELQIRSRQKSIHYEAQHKHVADPKTKVQSLLFHQSVKEQFSQHQEGSDVVKITLRQLIILVKCKTIVSYLWVTDIL